MGKVRCGEGAPRVPVTRWPMWNLTPTFIMVPGHAFPVKTR